MEDLNCSVTRSSLLCQENETCFDGGEEEEENGFLCVNNMDPSDTEDEYIEMLLSKERSFSGDSHGYSDDCLTENWLKCACLDAIQWILKMRKFFGFSFQTAYLSVTYLYRFLLQRKVDQNRESWAIQLLSVACLSLAAKMEECKIPALSEFQVENYVFESKVIQRMELLVLNTLGWRLSSVTPFAYLNYFITKFSIESRQQALLPKTIQIILDTIEVMNLINYRPSAIAAAAVLISSDQRLTENTVIDFEMGIFSSCGCLEHEHVFACYNLMRELEKRKMKMPNIVVYPDSSSTCASSADVLDAASFTYVNSKRKRLALNEYDREGHTPNEK